MRMSATTTRYYATGRRKNAIARVWLFSGSGNIQVNGRPLPEYVGRATLEAVVSQPLRLLNMDGKVDVVCTAEGGGLSGQAGAVRHGIARALAEMDPDAFRSPLRQQGFLTRDPRVKERKKYGRKRARRGFQFVKR